MATPMNAAQRMVAGFSNQMLQDQAYTGGPNISPDVIARYGGMGPANPFVQTQEYQTLSELYEREKLAGVPLTDEYAGLGLDVNATAFPSVSTAQGGLNQLYQQYLGREIGPEGEQFYGDQLASGRSLADIEQDLMASPEALEFRGQQPTIEGGVFAGKTVDELPDEFYQALFDKYPELVEEIQGIPDGQEGIADPLDDIFTETNEGLPQTGLIGSEDALRGGLEAALEALFGGTGQAREDVSQFSDQALAFLEEMFGQGTDFIERGAEAFDPFVETGQQANQLQAALSGALGPEAQEEAFANYRESPGQEFLRNQMEQSLMRQASAVGGLGSGNVLTALQDRAMGLAQTDFGNYFNRLGGVSGQGLGAAQGLSGILGQGAGLAGQQGQAGATLLANQGTQLADLAYGTGQGAANLFQNTAQNVATGRYNMGMAISDAIGGTTSALSNLQSEGGAGAADIQQGATNSLANLFFGTAEDLSEDQMAFVKLLADLSTKTGGLFSDAALGRGQTSTGGTQGILGDIGEASGGVAALLKVLGF